MSPGWSDSEAAPGAGGTKPHGRDYFMIPERSAAVLCLLLKLFFI